MVFKSNYNQVNQALLLWRYNSATISAQVAFSANSFFIFYFIQTQVYTLSLRGVKMLRILCYVRLFTSIICLLGLPFLSLLGYLSLYK
jgi:hypothetical protein